MHGTFEELGATHPGKWLLIRTDGPDEQTGTLLFADEDYKLVGEKMRRQPKEADKERPLYITWSIPDDDVLPAFVL